MSNAIDQQVIDKGDGNLLHRRPDWQDETWEALAAGFTAGADPLFRRLADTYLGLWHNYDFERTAHAELGVQMAELRTSASSDARALRVIGEMLREEAVSRDWCDDYGSFVAKVNGVVGREVLQYCAKEYAVQFNLTVTVEATNSTDATQEATNELNRVVHRMGLTVSFDHQDTDLAE